MVAARVKTTLQLERPLYNQIRNTAHSENKTMKKLLDEVLVIGLKDLQELKSRDVTQDLFPEGKIMGVKVCLEDKEAVATLLDQENFVK